MRLRELRFMGPKWCLPTA